MAACVPALSEVELGKAQIGAEGGDRGIPGRFTFGPCVFPSRHLSFDGIDAT